MKVLIVDDHALVRAGLRQLMMAGDLALTVGEAKDAVTAVQTLRSEHWDMVLLDINLPGKNGIELLKQIRQEFRKLRVLILSMHSEEQYAIRAIKNGALGYLTKDSAPEKLISAIQTIADGKRYITPELADKLAHALVFESEKAPHETLSDREYEVLCLLGGGMSVTDIGKRLSLSAKTISTYRTRLLAKMGLKNTTELIHYVVSHKLNAV